MKAVSYPAFSGTTTYWPGFSPIIEYSPFASVVSESTKTPFLKTVTVAPEIGFDVLASKTVPSKSAKANAEIFIKIKNITK